MGLHLSQIAEADELLTNDPLALLIGMMLNQQVSGRKRAASNGRSDAPIG
ncbi:transposase [Frankia sp. AiPs1]